MTKKLGKHRRFTQYEEFYIENRVIDFCYEMNIIEVALKNTI